MISSRERADGNSRRAVGGRLVLALLPLLVATACNRAERPGDPAAVLRLIERDPSDSLEAAHLFDSITVREWRFREPGDMPTAWTVDNPLQAETLPTPEGLILRSQDGRVLMSHDGELEGDAFDEVRVEVRPTGATGTGAVGLAWTAEGQGLSGEREIVDRGRADPSTPARTYRFVLRGHPRWGPEVHRLRLAFHPPPGGIVVERIVLTRERPVGETLARLIDGGVKAELGSDVRNALLGVPEAPIRWHIEVPDRGVLRLSYGTPSTILSPVRFRVWFETDHGDRALLSDVVVEPGQDSDRWHAVSVELSRFAGDSGDVELETAVSGSFEPVRGFPLWANPRINFSAPAERPNVVLISVDTLRPDRLSLYGYSRRTSPALDRWAGRSAAVFSSVIAQSTWTLPSHVSMLTGVDAFRHGVNFSDGSAPGSLSFLQETLREVGYFTMAITAGGFLDPRYGLVQGFDRYAYYPGSRATGQELPQGLDRALSWLDEAGDAPFFLFFHTYEVHTPWRSRQPWFDEFSDLTPVEDLRVNTPDPRPETGFLGAIPDSEIELVRPQRAEPPSKADLLAVASAAYDSGIAYTDMQIGRLLEAMADRGLDENTVVVFTSDHGEMLGEHGLLGHRYLYEENIRIPLVIALPGEIGAGRRIESQVRSIDIVPTILAALGLEGPPGLDGRSLVPLIEGHDVRGSPVDGEAWTYAPEVNYGLSLRVDNRFKYTLNDTVWAPLNGSQAVYLLGEAEPDADNVLADFEDADSLHESAHDKLALVPGTRIRLQSGPDRRIRGFVRGPRARPNRIKSIDLPCSCVAWTPGKASFEVPLGSRYTLILEGSTADADVLGLTDPADMGGQEQGREQRFDLTKVAAGTHLFLELTDAGWRESAGPPESSTNIEIWRVGQAEADSESTTSRPELLERLRDLGYIR